MSDSVHKYARIRSMAITLEEMEKLATLSRLALSSEEKERMRTEFDSILEYVASLSKVGEGTGGRSVVATVNVMREDANPHESGIHTEKLLAAAPKREGNYLKVKKIL